MRLGLGMVYDVEDKPFFSWAMVVSRRVNWL